MAKTPNKWQSPGVRSGPALQRGFRRGVDQVVKAISPTLGPRPRLVVNQSMLQTKGQEFLDDGAVIARRIIMLPDRVEDVGAMYLRQMLWNVHETAGDGTATAAVLFHSIYDQGLRYIAAGGNAMILRRHLQQATPPLLDALDGMSADLTGKTRLAQFAKSICHDSDLAGVLAEALDTLGPDGRLDIRSGRGRQLVLEFYDGIYWDSGRLDRATQANSPGKVSLVDPSILLTDLEVQQPQQLLPLLDMAVDAGIQNLVLVAAAVSEQALSVLALPANRQRIQVAAVKAPTSGPGLQDSLQDITMLVGGRPLLKAAGDTLEAVRPENLGGARRAWADKEYLGLESGKGDPGRLRQHIASLRAALAGTQGDTDRSRLQRRIGQLLYGSAALWVGATTLPEMERRKELAQRTVAAMRGALRERVVPGGGAALLALKPGLQEKSRRAQDVDERAAYGILKNSVDAPIRTLLCNSGHEPQTILAEIANCPAGYGYDVTRNCVVDMAASGIVDAASVVKTALGSAIQSAALALTIDVLVQRASPPLGLMRT